MVKEREKKNRKKAKGSLTLISFLAPIALIQVMVIMVIGLNIMFIVLFDVITNIIYFSILGGIAAICFVGMVYSYWKKGHWSVYILGALSGTLIGFLLCSAFASYIL